MSRRRKSVVSLLVLLASLACVICFLWMDWGVKPGTPDQSSSDPGCSMLDAGSGERRVYSSKASPVSKEPEAPPSPQNPPADSAGRPFELLFCDPTGAPVPSVTFLYLVEDFAALNARLRQPQPDGAALPYYAEGASDDAGVFCPPMSPHSAFLRLRLTSSQWMPLHRTSHSPGLAEDEEGVFLSSGKRREVVTLCPAKSVKLVVRYADLASFEGEVSVAYRHIGESPRGFERPRTFALESQSDIHVERVPRKGELEVVASNRRAGFRGMHRVAVATEDIQGVFEIVVPATAEEAGVRIKLGEVPNQVAIQIVVMVQIGTPVGGGQSEGGSEFVQMGLRTSEKLRILVTTETMAWESELFQLQPGEVREFTPKLERYCTCKARIVDENGSPLWPSMLNGYPDRYASWFFARTSRRWDGRENKKWRQCWVDQRGDATITNMPAGKRSIVAEAEGYESRQLDVELKPGEIHDLGEIRLKRAAGVIIIKLTNYDATKPYYASLGQPKSGLVSVPVAFAGGTCRLENVPYRWLYVIVQGKKRGGGGSRGVDFTLTPDKPEITIELDVAELQTD